VRRTLAVVAALAVAVFAGFVFGEQPFTSLLLGALMGALVAFFVGEATVLLAGERSAFTAVVATVGAVAGTLLAVARSIAWFDPRPDPMPGGGWAALAAAAVVAALTARTRRKTASGSSPRP
jgi:drug/metabolite transporter (DMT)-like permease